MERSPEAFAWADRNRERLGVPNARIVLGDLSDAVPEWDATVDVVVSNPPDVPDGMVPRDPEVQRFDLPAALYGGPDGLDPMRAVVGTALRLLRPGGLLAVEHGELQGAGVRALLGRRLGRRGDPPRPHRPRPGHDCPPPLTGPRPRTGGWGV